MLTYTAFVRSTTWDVTNAYHARLDGSIAAFFSLLPQDFSYFQDLTVILNTAFSAAEHLSPSYRISSPRHIQHLAFHRVRHLGEFGPDDLILSPWAAYKSEITFRNGQHCGLKLPFHISV